jgi:uncharacterized membrane protein YjjB (DUF3815 family)
MILQLAAAMVGTVSFSLLFGVPSRYYPYCGLIGAAGWWIYLVTSARLDVSVSTLIATMVVIFLSRAAAVRKQCPATVFLIAGIFPLVPGAGVYWTTYYMVTDQLNLAASTGYMALKNAVAIVLGIVFIFEIPQGFFWKIFGKKS